MSALRSTQTLSLLVCCVAGLLGASAVQADDLTFSAQVNQTTVHVGAPFTLTLTMSGDLAGVQVPAFQFPDGLAVVARSQATSFALRAGTAQRSTNLQYLLVAQRAGTYRLGPFAVTRQGQEIKTDPIDVTVDTSATPSTPPRPSGERFTL